MRQDGESFLPGLVLGAGYGRRIGKPKAFLRLADGRSFLEAVVEAMMAGGIGRVIAVLGPWWRNDFVLQGCEIVINQNPDAGMISSLTLGLERAGTGASGVLVALVDSPFVRAKTFEMLVQAHRKHTSKIILPTFGGKRGHPVVFPAWCFEEFYGAKAQESGPRAVVRSHPEAVLELEVQDPNVLVDIDDFSCYQSVVERGS